MENVLSVDGLSHELAHDIFMWSLIFITLRKKIGETCDWPEISDLRLLIQISVMPFKISPLLQIPCEGSTTKQNQLRVKFWNFKWDFRIIRFPIRLISSKVSIMIYHQLIQISASIYEISNLLLTPWIQTISFLAVGFKLMDHMQPAVYVMLSSPGQIIIDNIHTC